MCLVTNCLCSEPLVWPSARHAALPVAIAAHPLAGPHGCNDHPDRWHTLIDARHDDCRLCWAPVPNPTGWAKDQAGAVVGIPTRGSRYVN